MPSTAYPNLHLHPTSTSLLLQITSKHTRILLPSSFLASAFAIAVAVVGFVIVVDEVLGRNRSCNLCWDFRPLALIASWSAVAWGGLRMWSMVVLYRFV